MPTREGAEPERPTSHAGPVAGARGTRCRPLYATGWGKANAHSGVTTAPSTTFIDRGAPRGVNRYVVTAQDSAARPNESRHSNEVRVTLP